MNIAEEVKKQAQYIMRDSKPSLQTQIDALVAAVAELKKEVEDLKKPPKK